MPHNEPIKVLLVDDHPFVLEGIRTCLKARDRFQVVGVATNGQEAVEKGLALRPSVVVMDISMPVMNGLEATRHLRKCAPLVKVIILTVQDKMECATELVEAGAKGYICKNSAPGELMKAIECVHQGQTFFKFALPDPVPTGAPIDPNDRGSSADSTLSSREREVLTLIAEGFSNKQTASLLGVSVRTVEKHRERIMSKLQLHSVVQLTKYAIAKGMVAVS